MAKLDLLTGIRVVDMADYVAGPTCAKVLAEYGADVIRVEGLMGGSQRYTACGAQNIKNGDNPLYEVINGSKRQLALDTRRPEGLAVLFRLLERADVFVCHLREKSAQKLGLDWPALHERFPKLIYANVTGYGTTGPFKDKGGFDMVSYTTRSGLNWAAIPGENAEPYPAFLGQGDIPTGTYLAMGVLAAYIKRLRTGQGDMVTAHLYGAGIWSVVGCVVSAQEPYNNPWPKGRYDTFSPLSCSYRCSDGRWIMLCSSGWEQAWSRIVAFAGWDPSLLDEYPSQQQALGHIPELVHKMEDLIATRTADEWMEIFMELDIPCDVSLTFKEVAEDPVAFEANLMQEIHYEHSGSTVRIPRSPVHFREAGIPETELSGLPGADSESILLEYGYPEEAIQEMAQNRIIGLGDTWSRSYTIENDPGERQSGTDRAST